MGAFRHNSAFFHVHPDQEAFLGGGIHWRDMRCCQNNGGCRGNRGCRDNGGFRDNGGCRDDSGFWGSWPLWQVFL